MKWLIKEWEISTCLLVVVAFVFLLLINLNSFFDLFSEGGNKRTTTIRISSQFNDDAFRFLNPYGELQKENYNAVAVMVPDRNKPRPKKTKWSPNKNTGSGNVTIRPPKGPQGGKKSTTAKTTVKPPPPPPPPVVLSVKYYGMMSSISRGQTAAFIRYEKKQGGKLLESNKSYILTGDKNQNFEILETNDEFIRFKYLKNGKEYKLEQGSNFELELN